MNDEILDILIKKYNIKLISNYNKGVKKIVTFCIDANTLKKLPENQLNQLALVMSVEVNKKKRKGGSGGGSKQPKWAAAMEKRLSTRIDNVEKRIDAVEETLTARIDNVEETLTVRIDNLVAKNNLKE